MYLDVRNIQAEGLAVERTLRVGPLAEASGTTVKAGPVTLRGHVQRLRLGFEFRGEVGATVGLICSRCLEAFELGLNLPFEILYRDESSDEPRPGGEAAISLEDPAVATLEKGRIHLEGLAEEQIMLALPLKPLCRPDCPGLCARCGAPKDGPDCGCGPPVDPRLEVLRELKERLESGGRGAAGQAKAKEEES